MTAAHTATEKLAAVKIQYRNTLKALTGAHNKITPTSLAALMLEHTLTSDRPNNKVLLLHNVELVHYLIAAKIDGNDIDFADYTFLSDSGVKTLEVNKLTGGKMRVITELETGFGAAVGNTEWAAQKVSKAGDTGVGGNTRLYKHFRAELKERAVVKGGVIVMTAPLNGTKELKAEGANVEVIDLLTDKLHWLRSAIVFVERNSAGNGDYVVEGGIAAKMFGYGEWATRETNRTTHRWGKGTTMAIVDLPTKSNGYTTRRELVNKAYTGARYAFSLRGGLGVNAIATDEAFMGDSTMSVEFDTMAEAEAYKKLMTNNAAIKYFVNIMQLGRATKDVARFTKKIDLSQIKTGHEYPVEWGLTADEIAHVEAHGNKTRVAMFKGLFGKTATAAAKLVTN